MSHDSPGDDSDVTGGPGPVYDGAFSIEPIVGPVLWIYDLDDQETWGAVIHLVSDDDLGLSPGLTDELTRLGRWYDESFDWADPAGPSPWRQEECDRFNQAVSDTCQQLRGELGPSWNLHLDFSALHEHPAVDRGPARLATAQDLDQHLGQRRRP